MPPNLAGPGAFVMQGATWTLMRGQSEPLDPPDEPLSYELDDEPLSYEPDPPDEPKPLVTESESASNALALIDETSGPP